MRFGHFFRHFCHFGAYIVIEKNNTIFSPLCTPCLQVLVCLFTNRLPCVCIYKLRWFINVMSL